MSSNHYEIHDRLYAFALNILGRVTYIPKTLKNVVVIKQLIRSGTSTGANSSEADASESKKEFIGRFIIAKKEAQETKYWLRLLADHNKTQLKLSDLIIEVRELIAIIGTIIIKAQKTSQR